MDVYAVIMAGGIGSRFWPRSKHRKPKQLIRIFGKNTMIQDTVKRLEGFIPYDKIIIITNKIQKPRVKEQLPEIPEGNIIDEPFGKNTAACIGLASMLIKKNNEDAVMLTLPADHLINDKDKFQKAINDAAKFAESSEGLVTIGISPTRPEIGYGYIQFDEKIVNDNIHRVLTFAEKPNLSTARRFLESGDFLWNSGIFVWKVSSIISEIKNHIPDLYNGMETLEKDIGTEKFEKTLTTVYGQLKNISIDYGVMEKSEKVYVTKGKFDWNDAGSWGEVYELSEKDEDGNALIGDVYTEKTFNSYVFSPKKFTAVLGLENVIIINTNDSLLVCHRQNSQDVKDIVDYLRMNKKTDLL